MSKFKVGDTVRAIEDDIFHEWRIGDVMQVVCGVKQYVGLPCVGNERYINHESNVEEFEIVESACNLTGGSSDYSNPSTLAVRHPACNLTGGSSDYYKLEINGVVIECNDIIKALGLNFAQGNVFKAVWRIGADNIGKGKPGNTRLYNAEKVAFFGNDMVEMEKAQANG